MTIQSHHRATCSSSRPTGSNDRMSNSKTSGRLGAWHLLQRCLPLVLAASLVATDGLPASDDKKTNSCFGISCDFSGRLTPEQERNVPPALHNAFYIKSVRDISETNLRQLLTKKKQMAEETRDGVRYVAIKDYRCVDFGKGTSGMMIVIERYRVVDKQPTTRQDLTP
jgi:hypothetical protein